MRRQHHRKHVDFILFALLSAFAKSQSAVVSNLPENLKTRRGDDTGGYRRVKIQGIRLVGGRNSGREGRLEVQAGGEWGAVCDADWHHVDAVVICRSLGLGGGYAVPASLFRHGTDRVHLTNVTCSGEENTLDHCQLLNKTGLCYVSSFKVGVRCDPGHPSSTLFSFLFPPELKSRTERIPVNDSYVMTQNGDTNLLSALSAARVTFPLRRASTLPFARSAARFSFLPENPEDEKTGRENTTDWLSSVLSVVQRLFLTPQPEHGLARNTSQQRQQSSSASVVYAASRKPSGTESEFPPGRARRDASRSFQSTSSPVNTTSEGNTSGVYARPTVRIWPTVGAPNDLYGNSDQMDVWLMVGLIVGALAVSSGCIIIAWRYQKWHGKRQKSGASNLRRSPSKGILKKMSAYEKSSETSNITDDSSTKCRSSQTLSSATATAESSTLTSLDKEASINKVFVEARL